MKQTLRMSANVVLALTAVWGMGQLFPISGREMESLGADQLAHRLSDVPARTLDGEEVRLANRQPTLYLVFSPSCPFSQRAVPSWHELLKKPYLRHVRLVGLSYESDGVEPVRDFLDWHNLDLTTYLVPTAHFESATGITIVPSIFLADRNGKLVYEKQGGVIGAQAQRSIREHIRELGKR